MTEENNPTPEKQLLHLIEGQKTTASLHTAAIKYQGMSLFSFNALKGRFSFAKNRLAVFLKLRDPRQLDLKALNEILKYIAVLLALIFMTNIFFSAIRLKRGINLKEKISPASPVVSIPSVSSLLKTGSYYLEKARARDLFIIGEKNVAGAQRLPSQKIVELTQNLRLVGISWSKDPDVMIEDTKNQRTFFLKKGQTIDKEITVEAVFKDKVVLSCGGEEVELK